MKVAKFSVLIVLGLLGACGPVAQPETVEPESQVLPSPTLPPAARPTKVVAISGESSPVPSPTSEPVSVSLYSPLATPPAAAADAGDVEVQWSTDPAALIVSATFCCGFTTPLAPLNYIPDALIWGDGRILWVQWNDAGQRQVLQGQLTPEQMTALLQRAADDGFFGWQDRYANLTIADAADQCLSITLENRSKSVCEYFEGAPQAFHDLYDYLAGGAGATGTVYAPKSGYLTAYPLDVAGRPAPQSAAPWPVDSSSFSLSQAEAGAWVEGEILAQAWQMVNANPWGIVVREGEAYYQISLQIPGVSQTEPPLR